MKACSNNPLGVGDHKPIHGFASVRIRDREAVGSIAGQAGVAQVIVRVLEDAPAALWKKDHVAAVPCGANEREPAKIPLPADPEKTIDGSRHLLALRIGKLEG